jgi:membrane-bound lytic murein transglycosylase B
MPMMFSTRHKYYACLSAMLLALGTTACATPPSGAQKAAKKAQAASEARKRVAETDNAGEFANFSEWKEVSDFIDQLSARHGFERAELESVFRQVRYVDTAIQLMKPAPPGRPKNWRAYRARFVEPVRINAGVAFWDEHADALARAESQYGVPAEIIVGIIGVETVYGRNTGNFRVLDAVTTLGFDYPDTPTRAARMAYFRGEIENTLLFAREAGIDPFSLRGSYAGAIGWPQFMPGSIRKFAVDFDGDSKIDLRNSPVDAIGSVAHFLSEHGWQRGEPIVFPATVSATEGAANWDAFIGKGLEAKYRLDELKAAGVAPRTEPPADMMYGLVDLQNGEEATEYWLGAANFFAITQYNRSYFYAMSVVDLGRAVRTARSR